MSVVDLDGKIFGPLSNSSNGAVSAGTLFYYHHKDDYIWGHYHGGAVRAGVLLGRVMNDGQLQFEYSHYDQSGGFRAGKCRTKIIVDKNGLLQLHEEWQWTTGDRSKGTSILIEKRNN